VKILIKKKNNEKFSKKKIIDGWVPVLLPVGLKQLSGREQSCIPTISDFHVGSMISKFLINVKARLDKKGAPSFPVTKNYGFFRGEVARSLMSFFLDCSH
jgi:hypothetical protein